MSFEELMGTVQGMSTAVDALAAIGAELSLRSSGTPVDPQVEAALARVTAVAGVPDLESIPPPQQAMALSLIRLFFAQAANLLAEPARSPGWTFTDPNVLDGFGRGSMMVPVRLAAAPELANVSSFLDVGAGVGLLAVSAANVWPDATVVGIDVWEPSLERARANVGAAGLDDRIALRKQDVTALDDVDAFDAAWVPTFFLPEEVLQAALARLMRAVRPGGWVVLGVFLPGADPVASATNALYTIRGGGCVLDEKRAAELLGEAGFAAVHSLERAMPMPLGFVLGQRPEPAPTDD
jgi:SAM-dependent methyltransferase